MRVRKTAEERKSEIVETTLVLSDRVGPDRLSTGRIAKSLGITQAAIFRHFPTKQDLWAAVAHRIGEKYRRAWSESERADPDPIEQIRKLILRQLDLIESTPAIPAILFSRELHVENSMLRRIFGELMKQFHRRLEDLAKKAQKHGSISSDIAATDAADLLIGFAQGLVVRWSVTGRSFKLGEEARRLFGLQLKGLANGGNRAAAGR